VYKRQIFIRLPKRIESNLNFFAELLCSVIRYIGRRRCGRVQISYLIFLAMYSYVTMVELTPITPSVCEVIVWCWATTIWLDEIRQVECQ